ncbi:cytochrome-c oxidase, cbb3-type subunit III [Thiohalophilus sp.]|uniref:cytochrome-c oxidase, cbb3-type subunit III n=1 Tax=Thiohalophilus sp. TaxID=3028392 RepID=UPI003976464F
MSKDKSQKTVQTTGHAWDGDLQEFNNPLPNWWLWAFYATVVFAIIYWILYPTLPLGDTYTKGVMNDITYTTEDGKTVTTHWNTRALFEKEMQEARQAQAKYVEQLSQASYQQIQADPEQTGFAFSMAKVLFADNCAACHQTGGNGVMGKYPNLIDDAWLWGGSFEQIEHSIREGRQGNMPGFKGQLSQEQISNVSAYVLSLSDHDMDTGEVERGKQVFDANCAVCHGEDAKGKPSMGSANLTDSIWTIVDVPGAASTEAQKEAVMKLVRNGVAREMPGWKERLSDTEIKILTYYVHEMGGGN